MKRTFIIQFSKLALKYHWLMFICFKISIHVLHIFSFRNIFFQNICEVNVHICGDQKSALSSSEPHHLAFETWFFIESGAHRSARRAGQETWDVILSLFPQRWNAAPSFVCGYWGSEFRSSCWAMSTFTDWAVSPANFLFPKWYF